MAQQSPELLKALIDTGVVFVVVGGVAANIHGSSAGTYDLDVVAPLTLDNCERILKALGPPTRRASTRPSGSRASSARPSSCLPSATSTSPPTWA